MPNSVTLSLQIGQIRAEATLELPASFAVPNIIEEQEDALTLLAILQYTARNTLRQLDQDLTQTTQTQKAAK